MEENHKAAGAVFTASSMSLKELEAEIARSLKRANMRQLELILRIIRDITA